MFVVKRKNKNKSDKVKSQFIIIGSLLIVIGICLIGIKLFLNISENYREKEAISKFYDKQENLNVSTEVVEKQIGDEAIILYNDKTYINKVKGIETVDKTGKITVTKDKDVTALTLITCKPNSETEQIVIICELYKEE